MNGMAGCSTELSVIAPEVTTATILSKPKISAMIPSNAARIIPSPPLVIYTGDPVIRLNSLKAIAFRTLCFFREDIR